MLERDAIELDETGPIIFFGNEAVIAEDVAIVPEFVDGGEEAADMVWMSSLLWDVFWESEARFYFLRRIDTPLELLWNSEIITAFRRITSAATSVE